MSIVKYGKNSYKVSIKKRIDGRIYRFDKRFKTMNEAKSAEAEFIHNLDKGLKPTKKISFALYGQRYIDSLDGISKRTKFSYQQKFNYLLPLDYSLQFVSKTKFVSTSSQRSFFCKSVFFVLG